MRFLCDFSKSKDKLTIIFNCSNVRELNCGKLLKELRRRMHNLGCVNSALFDYALQTHISRQT